MGIIAINPTDLICQTSGLLGVCQDMSMVEVRTAAHGSFVKSKVLLSSSQGLSFFKKLIKLHQPKLQHAGSSIFVAMWNLLCST